MNKYADNRFNDLLFHSIDYRHCKKEIKRIDDDVSNVIRADIFIQSTGWDDSFSFSLIAFLSLIDGTNLDEIIIKSEECHGFNWIKSLWEMDEKRLKKAYAVKNYQIAMEKEYKDHNVRITKL